MRRTLNRPRGSIHDARESTGPPARMEARQLEESEGVIGDNQDSPLNWKAFQDDLCRVEGSEGELGVGRLSHLWALHY